MQSRDRNKGRNKHRNKDKAETQTERDEQKESIRISALKTQNTHEHTITHAVWRFEKCN